MNTTLLWALFQKEVQELWRDRKTLFWMVLSPLILYPFMFLVIGFFVKNQKEKIDNTTVTVLLSEELKNTPVFDSLQQHENYQISYTNAADFQADSLARGIAIVLNKKGENQEATLFYDETDDFSKAASKKAVTYLETYNKALLEKRMASFDLKKSFLEPVQIIEKDIAPEEQSIGAEIGKYLPAALLFFLFLGVVYIAMDSTAGEKERKTLQTLMTSPLNSWEIVMGKFLPILTVGVLAALANLAGLGLSLTLPSLINGGGGESGAMFSLTMSVAGWLQLGVLLIMAAALLSAVAMSVLALANTYKEASSYVTPLMMSIMMPVLVYNMPAMELNMTTSAIPVLNILMAMAELFAGQLPAGLMALVVASSIAFIMLGLYAAHQIFSNESVITGEKVNYKILLKMKKEGDGFLGASNAFLYFVVVMLLFIYIGIPLQQRDIRSGLPLSFALVFGGVSYLFIKLFKLDPIKTLKLNMPNSKIGWLGAVLIAVGLTFPIQMITMPLVPEDVQQMFTDAFTPIADQPFILMLALIALLPAVFEELVFRGIFYKGIRDNWGDKAAIILSAITFSLMHLSIYRVIPTLTMGLILGFVRWRSGSILLCSLIHFVYNGLAFSTMYMSPELLEIDFSIQLALAIGGLAISASGIYLIWKKSNFEEMKEIPKENEMVLS